MASTDLDEFIPKEELDRSYPLEAFHATVYDIRTDISSNGNKYTVVILGDGTWLFTWWDGNKEDGFEPGEWAEHLNNWESFYRDRKCEICVTNSNYYDEDYEGEESKPNKDDDPFFNITYICPESSSDAEKLLTMMRKK